MHNPHLRRVLTALLVVLLPGLSMRVACAAAANGISVFDSVRAAVQAEPTSEANLPARFRTLGRLVSLVSPGTGPEALEKALPRESFEQIVALLRDGNTKEAAGKIDRAILRLCDLGEKSPVRSVREVFFPGTNGVQVAGLLFAPEKPSKFGLVWGHGGYGSKEAWPDVALALSEAGVWVLKMDFEGTGESEGVSSWNARIHDFSRGIDFLQSELGLTAFAVGGHSGGGAWPAAVAAIDDQRVSTVVLWDCPFDFYDIHLVKNSADPGGNPAAVLEGTLAKTQGLPVTLRPSEVDESRRIPERLDSIYEEVEVTLSKYRHAARLLGEQQGKRRLAVLHIVAEELIRQLGPSPRGSQYELRGESRSEVRARYLGRPLRFQETGLFARPEGLWETWDQELREPKRTVLIRGTNHSFGPPGRTEAIRESVSWIRQHLLGETPAAPDGARAEPPASPTRTEVRLPVGSARVTVVESVPSAEKGAEVDDFSKAFPSKTLEAKDGAVRIGVGREPVYVIDGDTSLSGPAPAQSSPFGFHPAIVLNPKDPFGLAQEIGIRWHRGLYAYWIKIQPTQDDIDRGQFHWEQNDREWGAVPEGMAIFGNIGLPERLAPIPGQGDALDPRNWSWRLNQPEAAYLRFVKAVVERYDGDGDGDMPGLRVPIRVWQVENEPDSWGGAPEDYAHIQEITYRAIKEACPQAKVLMGGLTTWPAFDRFYRPVLKRLGGRSVDAFDFHYYGDAWLAWQGVKDEYANLRTALDTLGYAQAELWITEMGTYSGTPGDEPARLNPNDPAMSIGMPPPPRLPTQTERQQARDLVKRHVYPLALGVTKVFWAWGLIEGFVHDDGYFDHTGLVYDGEFDHDPPRGTKKLAYHAYRKMTETLDGADWSAAELLDLGKDVYAVRVPRGKGKVTVLWYDPPYPPLDLLPREARAEVFARLQELAKGQSDKNNVRERFQALMDVLLRVLDAGGPPALESWAPEERVKNLERKVLDGAEDAPALVDEMIRETLKKLGAETPKAERFIVLSEFQVWADAASPEVFKELSRLYNEKGRSHIFDLYPRYDLFVWDAARMRGWVDEAKTLGCFNVFCIGDDTRTAEGHLFDSAGVNPKLKDFLFSTADLRACAARWTDFEEEVLMPIRITCRDEWLGGGKSLQQRTLSRLRKEIRRHLMRAESKNSASYADPSNYC